MGFNSTCILLSVSQVKFIIYLLTLFYYLFVTFVLFSIHLILPIPAYRDSEANNLNELVLLQQNHNSNKSHPSGNICSQDKTH